MVICGYTSRNMKDPQVYADVLETRMKAKAEGDITKANSLKLVANTTFGATGARFNNLYDPLKFRSVCISGQLYLIELSCHLMQEVEDLETVQLNTDGLMVEFDDSQYDQVMEIIHEWEQRTGFTMEEDRVSMIIQKDVNGYIEVQPSGKVKLKGGKLVRGVLTNGKVDFEKMGFPNWENLNGGAFKINNDAVIIPRAVVNYFVEGIPLKDTVYLSDEPKDFQLIAKAGGKYSAAYHIVDGEKVQVQKVNRVYATSDTRYGTLVKTHAGTGNDAKVAGLPEHCIIDNAGTADMSMIDRSWYVKEAQKTVDMFLGVKPPKVNKRRVNSLVKKCMKILESID